MTVREFEGAKESTNDHLDHAHIQDFLKSNRRFYSSVDKKIEKIWHEAESAGWSYNEFVVYMLEVIAILQYRRGKRRRASS
jgi:hypothetical protein